MRFFKRYKITEHIQEGFNLEYRKTIFSEWIFLLTYHSKSSAINGIEKHKKIRAEYR